MRKSYIAVLFFYLFIPGACMAQVPDQNHTNSFVSGESDISIPVEFKPHKWQVLEYSNLPSHKVQFSSNGMLITVLDSASPLIYPMTDDPQFITGISIKGQVDRLVQIANPNQQGQKGLDDFNLRVGMVLLGNKRPSWVQRQVMPAWVKKMFALAPKNQGIDHIYFLNAVLSPQLLNRQREHPLSEYLKEDYAWLMNKAGAFSYSKQFQKPKWTGALWLSVDGDDTKSKFQIEIQEIILKAKTKKK